MPDLLGAVSDDEFAAVRAICHLRLDRYYSSIVSSERKGFVTFQKPQDIYGFMCNDYRTSFSVSGTHYISMMQFMAHRKALLMGDEALGRSVLSALDIDWQSLQFGESQKELIALKGQQQVVAYKGLLAKFSQNNDLSSALLDTGSSTLVACLPEDPVWGNGLSITDSRVNDIAAWPGKNLLGYTLMQVRNTLIRKRA